MAKLKINPQSKSSIADPKTKERLFADFFHAAKGTFEALEQQYGVRGVVDQLFGNNTDESEAQTKLRNSTAWHHLSRLYEYAVNGIDDGDNSSIVIDGSDVLQLASSEEYQPSKDWFAIVAMGDGRFALDDGMAVSIEKLALLAHVDVRTVRNAISAGELSAEKLKTDDEKDMILVDNRSARRWLRNRKGFKQTVSTHLEGRKSLQDIDTPTSFGIFLITKRKELEIDSPEGRLVAFHQSVSTASMAELEAGIFSLPLDAVFPLADFYQLSRRELLNCVMRVFFAEEMSMLSSDSAKRESQS